MSDKTDAHRAAIKIACGRVGKGVCKECGIPWPKSTARHIRCDACRFKYYNKYQPHIRAYNKRRDARILEEGFCRFHPRNELIEGKRHCSVCLEKNKASNKSTYARYRTQGICASCKKEHTGGNAYCRECSVRRAKETKLRLEQPGAREEFLARSRERYARNRDKMRESARERYARNRKEQAEGTRALSEPRPRAYRTVSPASKLVRKQSSIARIARLLEAGTCCNCGVRPLASKLRCKECLEANRASAKKYAKRKAACK